MTSLSGTAMKITIFTSNPKGIYSGGRYLAMILAYSLARAGGDVTYVTDNLPVFDTDFLPFETRFPVTRIVDPGFAAPPQHTDWVIVIPTGSGNDTFYSAARSYAAANGARVCLLSFETPNWFNAMAPEPRSELPWEAWKRVVDRGGLVATIAAAGIEPARSYYAANDLPLSYGFWHPPINDIAADDVLAAANDDGIERLVMFVRTEDRHKGAADLLALRPEVFAGRTLALVFGRQIDPDFLSALRKIVGRADGARIEIYNRISDRAKFWLLARSRLLLFPSHFEGFGYPPVEAAYMGVGSVAYDLPVVRETVGDAARYVAVGDTEAFSGAVLAALAAPRFDTRSAMLIDPRTLTQGELMLGLLGRSIDSVPPYAVRAPVAAPVPRAQNAVLKVAEVEAEWSAATSPVKISKAVARIDPTGLHLSCTMHGIERGDRLAIAYDHEAVTTIKLEPASGNVIAVETHKRLPPLTAEPQPVSLALVRGTKRIARLHIPVSIVPAGLLDATVWHRSFRPVPAGDRMGEAILILDIDRLLGNTRYAMAAAEIAAGVRAAGGRTRLIAIGEAPDPVSVDSDCLPLFDVVEPVERRALATRIAAIAGDAVLIADRALVPDMPSGTTLSTGGTARDAHWTVIGGAADRRGGSVTYRPGAAQMLRSVIAERNARVLVIGGIAGVEAGERLERFVHGAVRAALVPLGRVTLLVHQPLARASRLVLPCELGVAGTVTAVDLQDIRSRIVAAGSALLYDLSADEAGDPALAAIAAMAGTSVVRCRDALPEAETIVAAFERSARPYVSSDLAGAVTDRMATAVGVPVLATLATGLAAPREGTTAEPVAHYHVGTAIGFRPAGSTLDRYAVTGWGKRNEQGTEIAGAAGLLAFAIPASEARKATMISVHLRLRKRVDGAAVSLRLNGVQLASIPLTHAGLHMLTADIPPAIWNASGVQALSIGRHAHDGLPEIIIDAVAIETRATKLEWTGLQIDGDRLASVDYPAGPFEARSHSLVSAGEAVTPLATGWSIEVGYSWASAPVAVIDLSADPLRSDEPVLAIVTAGALIGAAQPVQRFDLSADGESLGILSIDSFHPVRYGFVVPPPFVRDGLTAIMIGSPDRISPKRLGINEDDRTLGMRIEQLEFLPLGEPRSIETLTADGVCGAFAVPLGDAMMHVVGQGEWDGRAVSIDGLPFLARAQAAGDGWEAWLALPAERPERLVLRIADPTGADERGTVELTCYVPREAEIATVVLLRLPLGEPDTPPQPIEAEPPTETPVAEEDVEPNVDLGTAGDEPAPVETEASAEIA